MSHFGRKNTRSEPRASNQHHMEASRAEAVKLQEQLTQLQSELAIKAVEKKPSPSELASDQAATPTSDADAEAPKAEVRTVSGTKVSQKKSSAGTQGHKHNTKKASGLKSGNYNQPAVGATKAGASPAAGGEVEKLQKAEGSLSGLASLKRVGNVKVISDAEGRNSTIKAKFTLGPLILRVEKSFKKGSVRSVKSATARTNEMIGRIKFSVLDDRATLMSIKVQQPKQVSGGQLPLSNYPLTSFDLRTGGGGEQGQSRPHPGICVATHSQNCQIGQREAEIGGRVAVRPPGRWGC